MSPLLVHRRYCANFTISRLQPLFTNKLINYVQLSVIPWGNARTDGDGKVRQQLAQHILFCPLLRVACQRRTG
jgi:hypothetical protein